jgi:hypothetical protein
LVKARKKTRLVGKLNLKRIANARKTAAVNDRDFPLNRLAGKLERDKGYWIKLVSEGGRGQLDVRQAELDSRYPGLFEQRLDKWRRLIVGRVDFREQSPTVLGSANVVRTARL